MCANLGKNNQVNPAADPANEARGGQNHQTSTERLARADARPFGGLALALGALHPREIGASCCGP